MEYENNRYKGVDMKRTKQIRKKKSLDKHKTITKRFGAGIDKLADMLPDFLVGSKNMMSEKYVAVYGEARSRDMITLARRQTAKMYLLLILITLVIIVSFVVNKFQSPENILDLKRNPYDGDSKVISAEVRASYEGETQTQHTDITVRPKSLTEKEKKKRINDTKKRLPKLILKDNIGLNNVTSDLNLITSDPKTGVDISWQSNNEEIVDEEGQVNSLVESDSKPVVLNADLRIDETMDKLKLTVKFSEPQSGRELSHAIKASIGNAIQKMSESDTGENVVLPDKTPEGVNLTWKADDKSGIVTQVALMIIMGVCVYYNRYRFLNRHIRETKESVTRDFPDFINKLVLLLNAGMVVTAAFEKITDDYKERTIRKKYLYDEFCNMEDNIRFANSGFLTELNDIAQRSGIRDLMRFNTIIVDNIDKGSALVEKLQSESNILWTGRIKMAEEKGKLAETKLTFPMVLQLLVLIIITIAPAAMEM